MEENKQSGGPVSNLKYITINGVRVPKRSMWSKQTQELINGVSLSLNICFGSQQTPIRKNIFFIGDDAVIYIGGRHIVEYDIIRKKQSFITKNIDDEAATALNFYKTKKGVLKIAVALKSTSRTLPQIRVYNTSKNLTYSLVHSQLTPFSVITDTVLGMKGKYLMSAYEVEKGKSWGISLWLIEKERLCGTAEIDAEVTHIDVNPKMQNQFTVSGHGYFGVWEYDMVEKVFDENQSIKQNLSMLAKEDVLDHCWIKDSGMLVVVVNPNTIYLFENYQLLGAYMFELVTNEPVEKPTHGGERVVESEGRLIPIEDPTNIKKSLRLDHHKFGVATIEPTAKGFVLGIKGVGLICLFELDKEKKTPTHLGSFQVKEENVLRVQSISASLDDMYLAIAILSGQKAIFSGASAPSSLSSEINAGQPSALSSKDTERSEIYKIDLYIFNKAVVDAVKTVHKNPFEPIFEKGVHSGPVLNITTSPSVTLITSLGEDHNIKFWEFGNEHRGVLSCYFHETPQCVSVHPHGFQVAVGFRDKLCFYYFIEEDLKLVHEYNHNLKNCAVLKYSEMGNMIAASSSNAIIIFDCITYTVMKHLTPHPGVVRELTWIDSDRLLLSSCSNGSTYCWNTLWNDQREVENVQRVSKVTAVAYDHDYDLMAVCCEDAKLRIYNDKASLLYFEYDSSPVIYTSILISHRMQAIFFGTNIGSIRVYLWPFTEMNKDNIEYIEFPVHQGPVTGLQFTHDLSSIVSASKDGSIYMLKIRQFADGSDISVSAYDLIASLSAGKKRESVGKIVNAYLLNSLILVDRAIMENKKEQIKELEFKIQNAKSNVEDEKEKKVVYYNQKIKSIEEKNRDAVLKHKETLAQSMEESDNAQKKILVDIEEQRIKHEEQMNELEKDHEEKLRMQLFPVKLIERSNELKAEIEKITSYCEHEIRKYEEEHQVNLKEVEAELHARYQSLAENFHKMVNNMKTDQDKFKEALKQSEDDFDQYREQHKSKLEQELKDKRKEAEHLRGNNTTLSKDNTGLHERALHHQSLIKDIEADNEQLNKDKAQSEKHLNMMELQLKEKEGIINIKEQQIKKYRDRNEHLQNFKNVFDHRVSTLKEEHDPLVNHLDNMEKHIKTVYRELIDEATSNRRLEEIITNRKDKVQSLKTQMKNKEEILRRYRRTQELYEHDLLNLLEKKEFEKWPAKLSEMSQKTFAEKIKTLDDTLFSKPELVENTIFAKQKDKMQERGHEGAIQMIRDELIRQRDFMNKKLGALKDANTRGEDERAEIFIRIQNENTNLINECNYLRQEKHILSNKIGMLEKEARDLAKDISASFLEDFRSPAQKERPAITLSQKIETLQPISPAYGGSPYLKYKDANKPRKLIEPLQTSLKKTQTNDILYSLLKEIDQYNDKQVRQKLTISNPKEIEKVPTRLPQSLRGRNTHTMTPTNQSPIDQGTTPRIKLLKREQSDALVRTTQESPLSKDVDTFQFQKRSNPQLNYLSGSSVNSSLNLQPNLGNQREKPSNL